MVPYYYTYLDAGLILFLCPFPQGFIAQGQVKVTPSSESQHQKPLLSESRQTKIIQPKQRERIRDQNHNKCVG